MNKPFIKAILILLLIILLFIAFLVTIWFVYQNCTGAGSSVLNPTITSFAECEAAGYPIDESYPRQCRTPDGKLFVEEIGEKITILGEVTCLPKDTDGPQTLECALGLQTADGKYYGLKRIDTLDPNFTPLQTGEKVIVTGILLHEDMFGPDGNRYTTEGVVEVEIIDER